MNPTASHPTPRLSPPISTPRIPAAEPVLRRAVVAAALVLGLAALAAAPVAAAPTDPFLPVYQPDVIVWIPQVEYDSVILVVSGPQKLRLRQEFQAGVEPFFKLFDDQGNLRPDGAYSYELQIIPVLTAEQRAAIKEARLSENPDVWEQVECGLPQGSRQADSFTVLERQIIDPATGEERALAALEAETLSGDETARAAATEEAELTPMPSQVVLSNSDGVIRNSLCVGFDCPNSPTFSDTTVLLMENNTRIKFDDTSTLNSFPRNDWEIEANSNLNGGASYLGFNDCGNSAQGGCATDLVFAVEAGVRQNALYVESDGDVGFGTSNPVVRLHTIDGDTPALRLEQDGSSGFAPQTWDVAGNETSFFIRDATNGSALPFRIFPTAPSNSLVVDGDGEVAIGSTTADDDLHVKRTESSIRIESTGGATSDHASLFLESSGGTTTSEFVIRANASTGSLEIRDAVGATSALKFQPGAANNSLVVATAVGGFARVGIGTTTPAGSAGNHSLDVNGAIFQRGGVLHADYVFDPGYPLRTIDEQAAFMWKNGHLPAIPERQVDEEGREVLEIGAHQRGIVEELEKAHIYIEQLHQTLREVTAEGERKDQALASLEERLARLEAVLGKTSPPGE